jgi:RNA polymerase sigma factor (sigma-70 family)
MVDADTDFSEFVRREHARLVGGLSLYCGDGDLAEEIAVEALLRARERWWAVRGMRAPHAWLYRVGVNLINSHFRRRRAERRAVRRLSARSRPVQEERPVAEAVTVRRAVAGLSPRLRDVVILRYFHDLSVRETAEVLDITAGSVKTYTHRAVHALRGELGVDLVSGEEVPHER